MQKTKRLKILSHLAAVAVLGLFVFNAAEAYYSFVRAGKRSAWPISSFTQDLSGQSFQGIPLSGLNVGTVPNDDTNGLLLVADASANAVNCIDASTAYGPPTQPQYQAVFNALAAWDSVTTARVNFAFVCAVGDIGIQSFDNLVDNGSTDLEIWRNGQPVFNSVNEIAFDDTATAQMILALNLGIDPTTLLGLAFPFDTNQALITDPNANGTLGEAFVIINTSGIAPSGIDLQGVLTHELGHLLGLGHTGAILNAAIGNDPKTPTMYFAALQMDSTQTRTLEMDDIAGITVNYPASGEPANSFGAISGFVNETCTALTGAAVIAENGSDEIGVIIGGNPSVINSIYVIDAVPPGFYTVRVTPLDGSPIAAGVNSSPAGSIDGIFANPAFTFSPIFFDDSSNAAGSTPIQVALSMETQSIDFGQNFGNCTGGSGLIGQVLPSDPDESCQAIPGRPFSLSSFALYLILPFATLLFLKRRLRAKGTSL